MSLSAPATPHPLSAGSLLASLSRWLPGRRSLLWVLLAFLAGMLLFVLVLLGRDRGTDRGGTSLPTAASPQYAPLPTPLPAAGADGASRLAKPTGADAAEGNERPRLVETRPPAPPPTLQPHASVPAPIATATSRPEPIAGQTPSPRYPAQALRRGESGTVNVRVEIGADGAPSQVSVEGSSGSRYLDRAATDAVRRWRFRPAMSNGQPVSGSVIVPIRFDAQR
ncbi:energy transducer TonB [Luteibacter sp.]|uniref:energy transducer TonB n=1 Tax=Luteibacter sp. TaxID=1886636 RepID=UPI002809D28E|nr:energy transducer TonB [Luteibacter sp.]MDQ8051362.1 energy transducer TonB [Luteibacter sp.]